MILHGVPGIFVTFLVIALLGRLVCVFLHCIVGTFLQNNYIKEHIS